MAKGSEFAKSLKSPFQWLASGLVTLFLILIFFGSKFGGCGPRHNQTMQNVRQIGGVMFSYAQDQKGAYPSGKSSTEVFQKLIDEGYVDDPTLFWDGVRKVPGKIKPTSKLLKPENVCWDVTIPLDTNSSDFLPVVFLTGYRINYAPSGSATPLFSWAKDWTGLAVFYHGNNAAFLKDDGKPDGLVTNFVSPNFDPHGQKYQQLTPDGPLAP